MGEYKIYRHAPAHLFLEDSIYFVTAGTNRKENFFITDAMLQGLNQTLFEQVDRYEWQLHAWAIFPNHYHFIARAPRNPKTLISLIRGLHSIKAKLVNRLNATPKRRIWSNYWDSCITNEGSFLARLQYVHMNAVKHGIVDEPEDYPYYSYAWFMKTAEGALIRAVSDQPFEQIKVIDHF